MSLYDLNNGVTDFTRPQTDIAPDTGFTEQTVNTGQKPVSVDKIPPAIWMVIFLAGGYVGLRWILED